MANQVARTTRVVRPSRRGGGLFFALMVVPIAAYVVAFSLYPLLYSFAISFFRYRLTDPTQTRTFIGLDNYARALADDETRTAALNTVAFVAGAVSLEFLIGLGLALLLWRDSRVNQVASALLLIPVALTPLVSGLVWRALLNADFGSIGWYLTQYLGLRRGLTGVPDTAMLAIILVDAWQWTPLMMLILLAGLKALSKDLFEAARVDGATDWQSFRYLVVPLLAPTIFLALVIRTMDAFKIFDVVFAMTQGGPGLATTVLNFYAYRQGLVFFDMGYAAALSNVLLVIIGAFSLVYVTILTRQDRAGRVVRPVPEPVHA